MKIQINMCFPFISCENQNEIEIKSELKKQMDMKKKILKKVFNVQQRSLVEIELELL